MRRLSLSIFLILLSLFIANGPGLAGGQVCGYEVACVTMGPDDPVTIAWMPVNIGAHFFFGQDSQGGIDIAIGHRGGNLQGPGIEQFGEDCQCTPEGGQQAARRLVANERVLAINGPNCSSAAEAVIVVTSRAELVLQPPSAVSSTLTSADLAIGGTWMPGYFRTIHTNALQGRIAAHLRGKSLTHRLVQRSTMAAPSRMNCGTR